MRQRCLSVKGKLKLSLFFRIGLLVDWVCLILNPLVRSVPRRVLICSDQGRIGWGSLNCVTRHRFTSELAQIKLVDSKCVFVGGCIWNGWLCGCGCCKLVRVPCLRHVWLVSLLGANHWAFCDWQFLSRWRHCWVESLLHVPLVLALTLRCHPHRVSPCNLCQSKNDLFLFSFPFQLAH